MEAESAKEPDDFYEFTEYDYYQILSTKKEDKCLKTQKIREAEESARRQRITKAVTRIRFPDNQYIRGRISSDRKNSKLDTIPPKKLIKDMSQDFHTAAFVPGAIVHFAYDVPNGDDTADGKSGPFLQEEVMSLKDLEFITEQVERIETAAEPVAQAAPPAVEERKPADKKPIKPKWLKL